MLKISDLFKLALAIAFVEFAFSTQLNDENVNKKRNFHMHIHHLKKN